MEEGIFEENYRLVEFPTVTAQLSNIKHQYDYFKISLTIFFNLFFFLQFALFIASVINPNTMALRLGDLTVDEVIKMRNASRAG